MLKVIPIWIMVILNLPSYGQNKVGIKLNLGTSRVTSKFDYKTGPQKFTLMPSGQIGFFFNRNFGIKSMFGAELLLIQIEGREKYSYPDGAQMVIRRNLSYIGFPIYYGYKVGKITMNGGFQFNYNIRKVEQWKGKIRLDQDLPFDWDRSIPNIESYDYGLKVGIIFNEDRKFETEGTYYHGLNNIWKSDPSHLGLWKTQQLTIGVRYKFLNED